MKKLIRRIIKLISIWWVYMNDFIYYAKYSLDGCCSIYKNEYLKAQMMLFLHALEKGMSFVNKKQNWGEQKAFVLCNKIREYAKNADVDEYMILAISVLNQYKKDPSASKNKKLINEINSILNKYERYLMPEKEVGVRQIEEPPVFNQVQIEEFFTSRFSVRDFSTIPITEEEIASAMKIANVTPTACNRQTSKVYAFRNKKIKEKILACQAGGQGWCENADTLFLITGNISFFGGVRERQQVYIDGGLFAMNFVWGLHLNHIGSCFKMYIRDSSMQKRLYKLLNLPANEVPIVLILAGHYKQLPILGPVSHRFNHPCIFEDKNGKQ